MSGRYQDYGPPPSAPMEDPQGGAPGAMAARPATRPLFDDLIITRNIPEDRKVPPDVSAAIAQVVGAVRSVAKTGGGPGSDVNYKYTRFGDLLAVLQPAMAEAGLIIIQREAEMRYGEQLLQIHYQFDFAVANGGTAVNLINHTGVAKWRFKKGDLDDKSVNKCRSGALKYVLMHLFLVPPDDADTPLFDGDTDGEPVEAQRGRDGQRQGSAWRPPPNQQWTQQPRQTGWEPPQQEHPAAQEQHQDQGAPPQQQERPAAQEQHQDQGAPPREDPALAEWQAAGGDEGPPPDSVPPPQRAPEGPDYSPPANGMQAAAEPPPMRIGPDPALRAKGAWAWKALADAATYDEACQIWLDAADVLTAVSDNSWNQWLKRFRDRWNTNPPVLPQNEQA